MEEETLKDDARWDRLSESVALLFARLGDLERHQRLTAGQVDVSVQILEQVLKDQTRDHRAGGGPIDCAAEGSDLRQGTGREQHQFGQGRPQ
jgi:hypothetical protein